MKDYTVADINNTSNSAIDIRKNNYNKTFKQIWQLGNKHLVIIDDSIIEKIGVTENSPFFVEQEMTEDNTTILMKIRKIKDLWKNEK
jgi:hypothetical protein